MFKFTLNNSIIFHELESEISRYDFPDSETVLFKLMDQQQIDFELQKSTQRGNSIRRGLLFNINCFFTFVVPIMIYIMVVLVNQGNSSDIKL